MTRLRDFAAASPAKYRCPHRELKIDEILAEPIVKLLMAADGVDADAVRNAFKRARTRRRAS